MNNNHNIEILNKDIFKIPKALDDAYFPDYINEKFKIFLKVYNDFDGELGKRLDLEFSKIDKLCKTILKALNESYAGFNHKAFYELSEGLKLIEEYLIGRPPTSTPVKDSISGLFYRARKNSKSLDAFDMFHVPFEKRHKIRTHRYSVYGLPCLYLSNSPLLCWRELQSDFQELQISRIELDRWVFSMLDLTLSSEFLTKFWDLNADKKLGAENLVFLFLLKWPLILSCSIPSNPSPEYHFKPQYTIPQMLLEWVRENKRINGIIYPTVVPAIKSVSPLDHHYNYAFPVQKVQKTGHCNILKKHIRVTPPISIKREKFVNEDIFGTNFEPDFDYFKSKVSFSNMESRRFMMKIIDESMNEIPYGNTIFMEVEMKLLKKKAISI